jgi:hypothetical protein
MCAEMPMLRYRSMGVMRAINFSDDDVLKPATPYGASGLASGSVGLLCETLVHQKRKCENALLASAMR